MHTITVDNAQLSLPTGFTISKIVSGRGRLRMMTAAPNNRLLITEMDKGNVLAISASGREPTVAARGLSNPSGITFHDKFLWVAEETQINKFQYLGNGKIGKKQVLIPNLPAGGHNTRTIAFGPDGKLYVTIGSSCNVCAETDPRRAALLRYNADGTGQEIFASGLRNTVGFVWNPTNNEIWGVDNGRDLIGDNIPPEELNVIKQGKNYGWPYCYGNRVTNPEFKDNQSRVQF
jgi:glucose/arabinose dehydrogenase